MKSPIMKASAKPLGFDCSLYVNEIPKSEPSPKDLYTLVNLGC